MKASELMLGDWVYGLYPNGKIYEPPFRISAVDIYPTNRSPRIVTEGGYGFQEEHLAPIPLTPEILEKNGWEEIKDYEPYIYYLLKVKDSSISLSKEWDSTIKTVYWSLSIGNHKTDATFSVDYIHELQHALRLCGIDLDIVI